MRIPNSKILIIAGVLLATASSGLSQEAEPQERPIAQFSVNNLPLLDALLQLGRDTDVPLGIECVDLRVLHSRITINLHNQSFSQVLNTLLSGGDGYSWSLDHGVVVIINRKLPLAPALNLLQVPIASYVIRRPATLAEASMLLRMELDVKINGPHGFAGSYNPGDVREKIGPISIENRTVVQILNAIVGQRKHAAWIAMAPPDKLDKLPPSGLWKIVEYSAPSRDYAADLLQLPQFQAVAE